MAEEIQVIVNDTQEEVSIYVGTPSDGVQSVTGDGVDNTDPNNPILTFPTPSEIGALEEIYNPYATIALMLADQAGQTEQQIIKVVDASGDTNITFGVGETKLQAYYEYNGVANGLISDYTLISAPYGNNGGGDIQGETATGNIKLDNIASKIYGETTALTGNITIDETEAIIGGSAIVYHNDSVEPEFLGNTSVIKKYGYYEVDADNTIMISKNGATTIGVVILQETPEEIIEYYLNFLTGDYITIPHDASINFERTDAFAFSFDIKTTSYTIQKAIIDKLLGTPSFRGFQIKTITTGILQLGIISNSATTNALVVRSTNAIPLDTWTTVHVSYDGSSNASGVKIWFDKVLETNNVITNALTATIVTTTPLLIGKNIDNTNYFVNDDMDNFKIFNQALTQTNVDDDDVVPIHSYAMDVINIQDTIGTLNGTATGMDSSNIKIRT